MSDWQLGYCDGRAFIETPRYQRKAAMPDNADYMEGFTAGAEDATEDKRK